MSGFGLALLSLSPAGSPDLAELWPDEPVIESIEPSAPRVESPGLLEWRGFAARHAKSFRLMVDAAGPHWIEARSDFFDCYLILRDGDGKVLAEADDGLFALDARLVVAKLERDATYVVDVVAPLGVGEFEVVLHAGTPPPPDPAEELGRAEKGLARVLAERPRMSAERAHAPLALACARIQAARSGAADRDAPPPQAALEGLRESVTVVRKLIDTAVDSTGRLAALEQLVVASRKVLGPENVETAQRIDEFAKYVAAEVGAGPARRLEKEAIAAFEKALGPDDLAVAEALDSLARMCDADEFFGEAAAALERCVRIRSKRLGPDYPLTLSTQGNLGLVLFHGSSRLEEAARLIEQVVALREKKSGPESVDLVNDLGNLALTLAADRRFADARRVGERARTICERKLGTLHGTTIATGLVVVAILRREGAMEEESLALDRLLAARDWKSRMGDVDALALRIHLANSLIEAGRLADARPLFEADRDDELRLFGPGDARFANALSNLASILQRLGEYDEARSAAERAVGLDEKTLGRDSSATATALANLAVVLNSQEHFADALHFWERALAVRERVAGPDHSLVASALREIAQAHVHLGDVSAAEQLLVRALSIHESVKGLDDPDTVRSLDDLTELLVQRGDMARVRHELEAFLGRLTARSTSDDPRLATTLARLGLLLASADDRNRGDELVERSIALGDWKCEAAVHAHENLIPDLATWLQSHGRIADARRFRELALALVARFHPGDARIGDRRQALAAVLRELGEFGAARALMAQTVADLTVLLGAEHTTTLHAQALLGNLLFDLHEDEPAQECFAALVAVRAKLLPADHPDLQESRVGLIAALRALRQDGAADAEQAKVTSVGAYGPLVHVESPAAAESTIEERSTTLHAVITDWSGVEDVQVLRDGVALSVRQLEERQEAIGRYLTIDRTGQKAELVLPLTIPDGARELRLVVKALNRRKVASEPLAFTIRHAPPQRELWLLAMGVRDYADDTLDLDCPVNDVDSIVAAFQAQEGVYYRKVHVERLVDAEVTAGAAKKALEHFLVPAAPADTLVVFAAGHGVRTELNDYYFLTREATLKDPYSGIDRTTLESLVTSPHLHARRRVLLIDTCQAGEIAPGTNDPESSRKRGAMPLVNPAALSTAATDTGTGLYILASSTDDQFAREQQGHGLFTRAVLDGLSGLADQAPQGSGDGLVAIEELKSYVYLDVLAKSAGRQQATQAKVEGGENFPLAKCGKR